ncbi:hypothetical protein CLOM_g11587 [Closterium sp. NIES-68]|nr:hypothetical protein CLOM_g11587 [Closterium sp. NIES-68]
MPQPHHTTCHASAAASSAAGASAAAAAPSQQYGQQAGGAEWQKQQRGKHMAERRGCCWRTVRWRCTDSGRGRGDGSTAEWAD